MAKTAWINRNARKRANGEKTRRRRAELRQKRLCRARAVYRVMPVRRVWSTVAKSPPPSRFYSPVQDVAPDFRELASKGSSLALPSRAGKISSVGMLLCGFDQLAATPARIPIY